MGKSLVEWAEAIREPVEHLRWLSLHGYIPELTCLYVYPDGTVRVNGLKNISFELTNEGEWRRYG